MSQTKTNASVQRAAPGIVGAAVLLSATSLLSRVLGLVRDRLLAGAFGAGSQLDVYYASFRIPDLVFTFLVLGAISAGFIPFFAKRFYAEKDAQAAWSYTNNILNCLGLCLLVLSGIGALWTPQILTIVAPGFDATALAQAVHISRIMYLSTVLLGLSSVFGGVLQGLKRFTLYAFAPLLYNLGIIIGVLLAPAFGGGIEIVAWGVVLGAGLHLALQLLGAVFAGWRWAPVWNLRERELREMIGLMGPRIVGLGLSQVNLIVMTAIASYLSVGSITVFNFANNIQYVPVGMFGIAFAIAAFPTLSEYAQEKKHAAVRALVEQTTRSILFLIVPISVVFLTLRAQIVRVVLGAGMFGWNETISTANVLAFFALSLFAQALLPLLVRVYFAYRNTLTPALIAFLSAIVNVALAIYWSRSFGVAGIAMAFSVANVLQLALLWTLLHRKLRGLREQTILRSLITMVISSLLCGLTIQAMKSLYAAVIPLDSFIHVLGQGFVAGGLGLLVYLISSWTWRSPECTVFVQTLRRKLPGRLRLIESADEAIESPTA